MGKPTEFQEANILINDIPLTYTESLTVRVALQSFGIMILSDGLGDNQHGIDMVKSYLDNIRTINKKIGM